MISNGSVVLASIVGAASRVYRVVRERKYANDRQGAMGGILRYTNGNSRRLCADVADLAPEAAVIRWMSQACRNCRRKIPPEPFWCSKKP
jgi:hypothetical protein